jgi:ABC-type glycerol-3-phosphate transport system substrate-binding protein
MPTRRTLIAAVALVVLGGCGGQAVEWSPTTAAPTTTVPSTTTQAPTTTTDSTSEAAALLGRIDGLFQEWNDNQIEWMSAFQDPNTSYEGFLRVQQSVMTRQAALAARLDLTVAGFPDDLAAAWQPLVDHMNGRVHLLRDLFAAAATGTDQQYEEALTAYQEFATTGALEALEAVFTNESVDALLAASGVSGADLLEAYRSMLGGPGS